LVLAAQASAKNNRLDQQEFSGQGDRYVSISTFEYRQPQFALIEENCHRATLLNTLIPRCNQASLLERVQSTTKELSGRTHEE
jgi:hypothetical protein